MISKTILLAVLTFIFCSGCRSYDNPNIPDELVGVWVTSDARYKDRFMEFKKDALIIGIGNGDQPVQPIRDLKLVPQDGQDLYTIYYLDPEGEEELISFFYDSDGGVITLKNQKKVAWKKQ